MISAPYCGAGEGQSSYALTDPNMHFNESALSVLMCVGRPGVLPWEWGVRTGGQGGRVVPHVARRV